MPSCDLVTNSIATSLLLVAGLALTAIAQRRGWSPSLRTALAVGVALRVTVWSLAAAQSWQPYDFLNDFSAAATAVLHHQDPMLTGRAWGWPFLPTLAYMLAAELKLGQIAHLQWQVVGRLVPVLADLVLIPLVGRLAVKRASLRRFQYACNPLAIMVCAIHGQLEPEVLALGVAALLMARSRRWAGAGSLFGLSVAVGSWSVLLAPGVLVALRDWRHRLYAACTAIAVPVAILLTSPLTVGTPIGRLPDVVRGLIGVRAVVGTWGWTAIVTHGATEVLPVEGRVGTLVLVAALVLAGYLWRRADPVDLTCVLLITFLLVSPRVGAQYLVWPIPFLIARPTRYAWPAIVAATVWAGFGYLFLWQQFSWMHVSTWALSSWAVIPLLALAMPWARRRAEEHVPVPFDEPGIPETVAGTG
jgi:Glycosyltransferase family 87